MTIRAIDTLKRAFEKRLQLAEIAKAGDIPQDLAPPSNSGGMSGSSGSAGGYDANYDWVYACVRAISQRIAGQSIRAGFVHGANPTKAVARLSDRKTYQKLSNQEVELVDSHEVLDLLADPNPFMVASNLMIATVASLELTGRAHWWLPKIKGKRQLWYMPTGWLTPDHSKGWFSSWQLTLPGSFDAKTISADEVVYFFYPDPKNPFESRSTLQAIYRSVSADESIQTAQAVAFKRGIFPGMAIIPGSVEDVFAGGERRPMLEKHQRQQIMAAILEMYRGVMNYGEPIILDALIRDIKPITNKPNEMDFRGSGEITKDRILQGFGVSEIIIGAAQNANRASAAVADSLFCDNTINPKISLLSQCMTGWLGPMFTSGKSQQRLAVYIEPARPNDPELLARNYQFAVREGIITPDEYRRDVLHLPAREGHQKTQLSRMVGGVTSTIQLIEKVTEGLVTTDSAEKVMEIFFGLNPAEAKKVIQRGVPRIMDEGRRPPAPPTAGGGEGGEPAAGEGEGDQGDGNAAGGESRRPVLPSQRPRRAKRSKRDWIKITAALHKQNEEGLAKALYKFFTQQCQSILKKLPGSDLVGIDAASGSASDIALLVPQIYTPDDWDELLIETARPHLARAAYAGAASELDAISASSVKAPEDYGIIMDVPEGVIENVESFLAESLQQDYWGDINETTSKQVAKILQQAIEDGGGLEQMRDGLMTLLNISRSRADTIARTETTGALNAGHYSARKNLLDLGLVTEQEWVTIPDLFRRPDHEAMEGVKVVGGAWFSVGGEQAPYPGYWALSGRQRVNCRCFSITSETFAD